MSRSIPRPMPGEYAGYTTDYITLVSNDEPVLDQLETNAKRYEALMRAYPASALRTPHAPGEWTLLDVLQHVIDNERVFAYRALRIVRGDQTPLPGYEQDDYAAAAGANARDLENLLAEYRAVRAASIALLGSLDDASLGRRGMASGSPLSVRAAAYVIAGHELYHMRSILENYGDPSIGLASTHERG
jgi:DinB family protein